MLKLLKYDLKWIYKVLIDFYIFTILFAGISRILLEFEINFFNALVAFILIPITICLMVGTIMFTIIRGWTRFTKNLYGDESYLTHTLPIERSTLLHSKFIATIISLITSLFVILLGLLIMFLSKDTVENLKLWLTNMREIELIIPASILAFLEVTTFIQEGNTGIILGHRSNDHKMAKSIFWGFISFLMTNCLIILSFLITGFFSQEIRDLLFTNTVSSTAAFKGILYSATGLYAIINIVYYLIDIKLLKKGINVD